MKVLIFAGVLWTRISEGSQPKPKPMTRGRVKRVKNYIGNEPFVLTYGNGFSEIPASSALNERKAC